MEKSSSSGDSSRKRHLDVGAGTSAGAGAAPKRHSSSSDDGEKETPIDKSPSQIFGSGSSTIPIYEGRYKKDFEEEELLGKGGYGKVYRCKNRLDDSKYAVKVIPFKDDNLESFLREVKILATVHHHRGIIHYYQCWIEDGIPDCGFGSDDQEQITDATKTLYIVMELCHRPLHKLVTNKNEILEAGGALRIFEEILQAIKYIHERGILHGDISRDNIFLTADGQVKIGDFGLARKFGDNMSIYPGNLIYQAPELLLDPMSISAKSDLFALGLVAFETFNRMETDNERAKEFEALKEDSKVRGELEGTVIGSIIEQLLAKDPKLRPSAAEVLLRFEF